MILLCSISRHLYRFRGSVSIFDFAGNLFLLYFSMNIFRMFNGRCPTIVELSAFTLPANATELQADDTIYLCNVRVTCQ